jgi:hypothetical protein
MRLRNLLALLLLALAMGIAACGDDDDDENGGGGGGDETAEAAQLEIESTEAGKGRTRISVPSSVEAGLVEISFTNAGKKPHEAQLLRLEGGHTAEDAIKAVTGESGKVPGWIEDGGGVGITAPGQTATATQVLEPGNYAVIDVEQTGSASLEVTGEPADAELPETGSTVTASEYTFETSGLKTGENTVLFENTGKELHHIIAAPVKPGTTPQDMLKFYRSDGKGPVPYRGGEDAGVSTAVIDGGVSQVIDLELEAGTYAFQCFIPDRAGGPPHAAKGMVTIEEIQ